MLDVVCFSSVTRILIAVYVLSSAFKFVLQRSHSRVVFFLLSKEMSIQLVYNSVIFFQLSVVMYGQVIYSSMIFFKCRFAHRYYGYVTKK